MCIVKFPEKENYPERTVVVLNDGNTVIVVDDHCYVIRNRGLNNDWSWSGHIFHEASQALRKLPINPDDAKSI